MQKYKFNVNGMHCASCTVLIESEIGDLKNVSNVKATLNTNSVEVEGDFGGKTDEHIAKELSKLVEPHGYSISLGKTKHKALWGEFKMAVPFALAFIAFFIALQKMGIVNLVNISTVTYGTAFIIGLVASVSTCMAIVGGIVLSMSANFAKGGDKVKPQALFHIGRLISFFILGGVVGAIGSVFQLGITGMFIFGLLVALVLIVLGINLLDIFPWAGRLQLSLPGVLGRYVLKLKEVNHTLTPFIVGAATFFMPCGFTQAMQLYALTTGSFWVGALTMFSFALGTLPVLALISFSSFGMRDSAKSGVFFKTAGLVVIFFGVLNLINSLVVTQIIPPLFSF